LSRLQHPHCGTSLFVLFFKHFINFPETSSLFLTPQETFHVVKSQHEDFSSVQAFWSLVLIVFFIAATVFALRGAEPYFSPIFQVKSKPLFNCGDRSMPLVDGQTRGRSFGQL
jgi:hypothetical protein